MFDLKNFDDDKFLRNFINNGMFPTTPRIPFSNPIIGSKSGKLDIKDEGTHYLLCTDMPGYEKKDISVEVVGGMLNISATKDITSDENDTGYIRKERYHGKLSRSIYIGEEIKPSDIKASLVNGVLSITIPKLPEPEKEVKKIDIE